MKRFLPALAWTASVIVCRATLAEGPTYVAVVVYHVTNVGQAPVENSVLAYRVPASNRYQEIVETLIDPAPAQTVQDAEGQTLALADLGPLAVGQTKAVRIFCRVRCRTATLASANEKDGIPSLRDEEKAAYLADAPPFGVSEVRDTARDVCARASSPMGKAKAIFDYITQTFEYDLRDHLDPAPAVIRRKLGSCSELAFAFVALCRAAGVPARVVTSFRNREGATPSVDWVGHRWAEFYAEEVGWFPVDPTNQINGFGKKSYWGRQDPEFIALIDDGSAEVASPRWEAMLAFYRPADSKVATKRFAAWRLSHNAEKERDFFEEGCRALRAEKIEDRIAALEGWQRSREPLRGVMALEAAFDSSASVRRQAAKAMAAADDPTLTLPMLKLHEQESDENVKAALLQGVRSLLHVRNDKHREIALANVIKSRLDSAVPLVAELAADPSVDIRWRIAATLYRLGDKPAVNDAYATLLDDPEEMVRFQAAKQWSRLGSWKAAERLVKYLASPDPRRRTSALEALRRRAGTDFGFKPIGSPDSQANQAARERWDRWVRQRGQP